MKMNKTYRVKVVLADRTEHHLTILHKSKSQARREAEDLIRNKGRVFEVEEVFAPKPDRTSSD